METLIPAFATVLVLSALSLHEDTIVQFQRVWRRIEARVRRLSGRRFTPSDRVVRQHGRPWCE